MAGIQLSTAGVKLLYAAEATAGTRPTTGYKEISEIKSIPELNPEPTCNVLTCNTMVRFYPGEG